MDAIRTSCYSRERTTSQKEGCKQQGLWSEMKLKHFGFPWPQNCFWLPQMNILWSASLHLTVRISWGATRWWNKNNCQELLWNLNGLMSTLTVGDTQLWRNHAAPFQRAFLRKGLSKCKTISSVSDLSGRSARAAGALRHPTKPALLPTPQQGTHQQSWGLVPSCHCDSSPAVVTSALPLSSQQHVITHIAALREQSMYS